MTAIRTEQDNDARDLTEGHSELSNVRTKHSFDEYIVLIVGINDCDDLLKKLSDILSNDLIQSFNDVETALKFIHSQNHTNILFIISNILARDHASILVTEQQIVGFYIYYTSEDKQTVWRTEDKKVRSAVSDSTALLAQLHGDINEYSGRWPFDQKSFQKALTNTSQWYHLFLLIVCFQSQHSDKLYKEMFDECRVYYRTNTATLQRIDEFQRNYNPNNAIREYTRDSFLYRIINRALRTQNMEIIRKFSPFISDLHAQLRQFHHNYFTSNEPLIRSVYRGQYLSPNELNSLRAVWKSNNPIITLTTFGSTSLDPDIAINLGCWPSDSQIPCLFEIILTDKYNETQREMYFRKHDVFATIASASVMPNEQEVLFSPGIHFRIKSIEDPVNHSDLHWVLIVLEAVTKADEDSQTNYLNIINQIKSETDAHVFTEILDMLQVNIQNEMKFQQTNWKNWWNALKNQWGKHYLSDKRPPLHLTFYSCFSEDPQWSRKAIEIYKTQFLSIPDIQSHRSSLSYLFKMYEIWLPVPAIWIALYEDCSENLCQTNTEEVIKCLCLAGKTYGRIGDHQRALECYRKADPNDQSRISKEIQKEIKTVEKLAKKMSTTKNQHRPDRDERSRTYQTQEEDQCPVYRMISKTSADGSSIQTLLFRLLRYIEECQRSYDIYDSRIILRFPYEITQDLSVNDYYCNFFLALQKHFLMSTTERDSANHQSLSLRRYEKHLSQWILFKALDTFLRPFEMKSNFLRRCLLPDLKRFLKKLTTLIVTCFFYICVERSGDQIHVNTTLLINTRNTWTRQPALCDLFNGDVRAGLEALAANTSADERISISIADHIRFDKTGFDDFIQDLSEN